MNFFSYESKPMQILMLLGDLIILNLLFILCSLPVFTIGAAQAGLYTGLKTLLDPEDDTYISSAFFNGFKTGFGKITIAWNILLVADLILGVVTFLSYFYTQSTTSYQFWAAFIALCISLLFHSLIPLFHARFTCTPWQLIRNAWFLIIAHPLRSLLVGILTWLPVALFFSMNFVTYMTLTPIFILIYYSGSYLFGFSAMKKPFKVLIDHYNQTHGITPPPETEEELDSGDYEEETSEYEEV